MVFSHPLFGYALSFKSYFESETKAILCIKCSTVYLKGSDEKMKNSKGKLSCIPKGKI